jgi:hypothetical protein
VSFLETKNSNCVSTLIPNPSPASGRRELNSLIKKQKFIVLNSPLNHAERGLEGSYFVPRESNKAPFSPRREGLGMRGEQSTS